MDAESEEFERHVKDILSRPPIKDKVVHVARLDVEDLKVPVHRLFYIEGLSRPCVIIADVDVTTHWRALDYYTGVAYAGHYPTQSEVIKTAHTQIQKWLQAGRSLESLFERFSPLN